MPIKYDELMALKNLGQKYAYTDREVMLYACGIGMGAEFRAQTDENSYLRLGVFSVKDRLFGPAGENQGGTAFFGEGVQFLGHGWLAVGNVSLVSSLAFRQVFSDDIAQVIDPRRESTFYANNNTGGLSFNFLAANETTTLFRPSRDAPTATFAAQPPTYLAKVWTSSSGAPICSAYRSTAARPRHTRSSVIVFLSAASTRRSVG